MIFKQFDKPDPILIYDVVFKCSSIISEDMIAIYCKWVIKFYFSIILLSEFRQEHILIEVESRMLITSFLIPLPQSDAF